MVEVMQGIAVVCCPAAALCFSRLVKLAIMHTGRKSCGSTGCSRMLMGLAISGARRKQERSVP